MCQSLGPAGCLSPISHRRRGQGAPRLHRSIGGTLPWPPLWQPLLALHIGRHILLPARRLIICRQYAIIRNKSARRSSPLLSVRCVSLFRANLLADAAFLIVLSVVPSQSTTDSFGFFHTRNIPSFRYIPPPQSRYTA